MDNKYDYSRDEKINSEFTIRKEHGEVFNFVPKKVYVVYWSDFMETGIDKIFYDEEKAKEYIKYRDKMTGLTYSIDEVDVEDA